MQACLMHAVVAEWDWNDMMETRLKEPLIAAVPSTAPGPSDSARDLERLLPSSKAASVAKAPLYGEHPASANSKTPLLFPLFAGPEMLSPWRRSKHLLHNQSKNVPFSGP